MTTMTTDIYGFGMSIANRRDMATVLEGMMDSSDLPTILSALSEVCSGKADHTSEQGYQRTSRRWQAAANRLESLADTPTFQDLYQ